MCAVVVIRHLWHHNCIPSYTNSSEITNNQPSYTFDYHMSYIYMLPNKLVLYIGADNFPLLRVNSSIFRRSFGSQHTAGDDGEQSLVATDCVLSHTAAACRRRYWVCVLSAVALFALAGLPHVPPLLCHHRVIE